MKYLIVGNWKMNPTTLKEAKALFDEVKKADSKNADVVICPPFVFLPLLKGATLGAQNVFYEEKGAFTGEISPQMLKSSQVDYVIIGHSERRNYFGESNEMVNKKIKAALKAGLEVIFCVGENEGPASAQGSGEAKEDKQAILESQVAEGLKSVTKEELKHVTIAYEPVWAIGTGKNCSTDETMKAVILIRKLVTNLYNRETADAMKVLYGGSVNAQNSADYLKNGGVNGFILGGASLKPDEFVKIVESAE